MYFKKAILAAVMVSLSATAMAGGLLTNTNQSISFLRNPARDGAIGIDGVYSNPAGVAFLSKGFHLALNIQNAYQTRTIYSGMAVDALQGTPYYHPLSLYNADAEGIKKYRGKAAVPILPTFQAALNYDKWGFQLGFSYNGGGGKASFNEGLGSFERIVALTPVLLAQQGITTDKPAYSVDSYINGQQYVFGLQFGATYKLNEHVAFYGGARFNYAWNKYEGNIVNIKASINGQMQNLYDYFGAAANDYSQMAFYYRMRATEMTDPAAKAKYDAVAAQYKAGAEKAEATRQLFADKYVDCTQMGWGITPIIGIDVKTGKWNFATRLEFTTHFNIENNTKRDDTGLFTDGVNTPNDLPGLWSVGAQYEPAKNVRLMAGWHYFFDKDAKMADDKQTKLDGNTMEFLAGAEWDVTKNLTVSAGYQRTQYFLGDGEYLNDMSFVTPSNSFGFGARFQISKRMKAQVAYFWTNYETKNKTYTQEYSAGGTTVQASNTDAFTRTNKVLGAGVEIDF